MNIDVLSRRKKKVIIFAANVVTDSSKSYELFCKEFRLTSQNLMALNKKYFIPAKNGKYSKKELVKHLSKELRTSQAHIYRNAEDCARLNKPNKGLIKIISELKMKGCRVAMVNNTNALFSSLSVEKDLEKKFDVVVLSHKVKSLRPLLKQYKEALRKLKVKPEDCIYVDRKMKLIFPAKKLGMKTILYENNKELRRQLK